MGNLILNERYEVLDRLGRGGMAYVCRARDLRLLRDVAVKILDPARVEQDRDRALFYFHREARAVAALRSRNIVQIHDYSGPDEPVAYLVMELIEGGDLDRALLTHHPLPEPVILSLAHGVACGVRDAHATGVIHRDIKPANILVEKDGRVVLSDFGIAKAYRDPMKLGRTLSDRKTQVFGTLDFMAPEQILERETGPHTDVFSLGSLIYCLCTYRSPFDADQVVEIMRRVIDVDYPPLLEARSDLSPELADLVRRCLRFDGAKRMTAAEVVTECQRLLTTHDITDTEGCIREFVERGERTVTELLPIRESMTAEPPVASWDVAQLTRRVPNPLSGPVTTIELRDEMPATVDGAATTQVPGSAPAETTAGAGVAATAAEEDPTRVEAPPTSREPRTPPPSWDRGEISAAPVAERAEAGEQPLPEPLPAIPAHANDPDRTHADVTLLHRSGAPVSPQWIAAVVIGVGLLGAVIIGLVANRDTDPLQPTTTHVAEVPVTPPASPAATPVPVPTPTPQSISGSRLAAPMGAPEPGVDPADTAAEAASKPSRIAPAKRRRRPRPARAAAPGTLEVLVRPWGNVSIDGNSLGATPLSPVDLAPGRHRIAVRHPSLGERSKTVTIKAGERTTLQFDLRRGR